MNRLSLLLTLLLQAYLSGAVLKKINLSNADCKSVSAIDEIEINCVTNSENPETKQYNMKYVEKREGKTKFTISCNNVTSDYKFFPDLNIGEVTCLDVSFCPKPSDGFKFITNKLNLTSLYCLKFNFNKPSEGVLTKEDLAGLDSLISLTLIWDGLTEIDEETFTNVPNLEMLDLSKNSFNLSENLFENATQLRRLDLTRNGFTRIPEGVFRNLVNLTSLDLWENKLTEIEEGTFSGLTNLETLEISFNKITYIHKNSFSNLINLLNISLSGNKLSYIEPETFALNKKLEIIKLNFNRNLTIPATLFRGLSNLKQIQLKNCEIETLPPDAFVGLTNLTLLSMKGNLLKELHKDTFNDLTSLETLDLSSNELKDLDNEIFKNLKNVKVLNIESNLLKHLAQNLLAGLINLRELNLKRNQIEHIDLIPFYHNGLLERIDMSHNYFDLPDFYGTTIFNHCRNLVRIDMSHNLITNTNFQDLMTSLKYIERIDFSHNLFTNIRLMDFVRPFEEKGPIEVDLSHNNITVVSRGFVIEDMLIPPSDFLAYSYSQSFVTLNISDNSIMCDCNALDLVKYFQDLLDPRIKMMALIKSTDVTCAGPEDFKGLPVNELKPLGLTCPWRESSGKGPCTDTCDCYDRPYDNTIIADCSHRNLTRPPRFERLHYDNNGGYPMEIIELFPKGTTMKNEEAGVTTGGSYNEGVKMLEVHLENNSLVQFPERGYYENLRALYLGNNRIKNVTWIPSTIEVLQLHNNGIESLNSSILLALNSSKTLLNLTLHDNPWICNCSMINFADYLRRHYKQVDDSNIRCHSTGQRLLRTELCPSPSHTILVSCIVVAMALFVAMSLAALYYRYNQEIKVYLYARGLCLWLVSEEEVDKDKLYDAFVSYSQKDEEFLTKNLLPELEGGVVPYKLCLHFRDWVPGEYITTQIANSVRDSRRTVILLSPNFLESDWTKMEFQASHVQAMKDKRARVIIILLGKIDQSQLDEELRLYLRTNTYLEWGDPWFWDKLRYALPHRRRLRSNHRKHANMMMSVDDKFQLVAESPGVKQPSTPPAFILEKELLKGHSMSKKEISEDEQVGLRTAPVC